MSERSERLRSSPPMFNSRLLDTFSRVHWSVPLILFIPIIGALGAWELTRRDVLELLGLVVVGYLFWTLFEYWLHRIVFHFEPDNPIGSRMHWIIHGVHHDHPNDPLRLVMPPGASVPLGIIVFAVMYLVLGRDLAPGVGCGFFAGYLAYDMLHFYIHHAKPHGRIGRLLRERHMRHHFQDATRGFGISAPYWDDLFRTAPQPLSRQRGGAPANSPRASHEPAGAGGSGTAS